MSLSRRQFLRSAGAVSLGFTGLRHLVAAATPAQSTLHRVIRRYGELVPDPDGIFDLPPGFSYRLVSASGDVMSDGFVVPALSDGMATFAGPDELTILIRNHEVDSAASGEYGAFGSLNERYAWLDEDEFYDAGSSGNPCLGGTTTVVYDTRAQEVVNEYLSLAGTLRNCAGGPTPWNTWVTCEETVERAGSFCARDHGYCFEVPASLSPRIAAPVPLVDMGRFNHEAVAVDPVSGIVFETEDRNDGLIYRYIPNRRGHLREGGRLQALVVRDMPRADLRNWEESPVAVPGQRLPVEWIDLDEVEAPEDDLRLRGFDAGAARFARGEGMWYGNGTVYFACTNGGHAQVGQIWSYAPSPYEGTAREAEEPGVLELFVEPNDRTLVEHADNLTVAPWGDLVVCEDGPQEQYLVGVTPEGALYQLGRNALNHSELAGATFSPDGSTLFVNIQVPGLTLAITGPWTR